MVNFNRAFKIGVFVNVIYIAVELILGLTFLKSSALVSDGIHNLSDVMGLLVSWLAMYLATRKSNIKFTYGYKQATNIGALVNAIFIGSTMFILGIEAINQLLNPIVSQENGLGVMIVAGLGIFANFGTALLFMKGSKEDINIRGAFVHMAADAGVSIGVVISGLLNIVFKTTWIDPLATLIIVVFVLISTFKLFSQPLLNIMGANTTNISLEQVSKILMSVNQVKAVHDIHIWAIGTTDIAISAHVVYRFGSDQEVLLEKLTSQLKALPYVTHTVLQLERADTHLENDY